MSTPDSRVEYETFLQEYPSTDVANIGENWAGYLPENVVCYDIDQCDITQTPLPKQHQIILCTDVFEHLYDPVRAAENIVKSLLPGGYLFFTAPSIWPYHECPIDTYRYTDTAIKWLFRDLTILKCWKSEENIDAHRVSLIGQKVV